MNKKAGWTTTGLITATAALGFSLFGPPGRGKTSDTPEAASSQGAPVSAKMADVDTFDLKEGPCAEIEERLQDFFTTQNMSAPESCFKGSAATPNTLNANYMNFAIAILPDPLHTHFSLSFDRYAEAIQQAAQDEHFAYDSSWLPWSTEEKQYTSLHDNRAAETITSIKESQPGVLLFRGPSKNAEAPGYAPGLAIFVVGEEPTGGVHREQFRNALAWIEALGGQPDAASKGPAQRALRIIGPSFSGSLPSLAALLKSSATLPEAATIYSGSITDSTAVTGFSTELDEGKTGKNIAFRSFQESDERQINAYCKYLFSRGATSDHVAIISEDETAFGVSENAAPATSGEKPAITTAGVPWCQQDSERSIRASYPRDISALRSAYQAQSLFSIKAKSTDSDLTRRTLKTDLADPEGKQHDTIRSYSGSQTALSQEASLQQIVRTLRVHGIQYIVLRSSNPLDQIFLTRYLMLEYPEGRIAVATADLLLERDLDSNGISGVTTLSSYPLIPSGQDWTIPTPLSHIHRPFTNSEAEGTYVATRFLLREPAPDLSADDFVPHVSPHPRETEQALQGAKDRSIADYSVPFWSRNFSGSTQPDIWVSVLGHGGFWPVSAMERGTAQELGASDRLRSVVSGLIFGPWRDRSVVLRGRGLDVPLSMKIVLVFVCMWTAFHVYCCCQPSVTGKPGFRVHFAWSQLSGPARRSQARLIVFGSTLVGLVPPLLAWSMGCFSDDSVLPFASWKQRLLLVVLWLAGLIGLIANAWIERSLKDADRARKPDEVEEVSFWSLIEPTRERWRKSRAAVWRCLRWYLGGTLLPIIVFDAVLEWQLNDGNRVATYIRSMSLTSAVSPAAPFLILIAGLYGWFWFALKGQALLGDDRPLLPRDVDLPLAFGTGNASAADDGGGTAVSPKMPTLALSIFGRESVSLRTERDSNAASGGMLTLYGVVTVALLLGLSFVFGSPPIRSLGADRYSLICLLWLCGCTALLVGSTLQLVRIWFRLKGLLILLDRTPLRSTFMALDGFTWGSIWTMAGNVLEERYQLYSKQTELLSLLEQRLKTSAAYGAKAELETAHKRREEFSEWYLKNWNNILVRNTAPSHAVQEAFARLAGAALACILVPDWMDHASVNDAILLRASRRTGDEQEDDKKKAKESLPLDKIALTERFVCLVFIGFIQNTLGRMRSLVSGVIVLFIALALGSSSYPFDPRPLLNGMVVVLFFAIGFFVVLVYSQMYRDSTLSHLTNTDPGSLGTEFWLKLIGFGIGPVVGLLASVFPEVSNFFFSWMQPGIESLK